METNDRFYSILKSLSYEKRLLALDQYIDAINPNKNGYIPEYVYDILIKIFNGFGSIGLGCVYCGDEEYIVDEIYNAVSWKDSCNVFGVDIEPRIKRGEHECSECKPNGTCHNILIGINEKGMKVFLSVIDKVKNSKTVNTDLMLSKRGLNIAKEFKHSNLSLSEEICRAKLRYGHIIGMIMEKILFTDETINKMQLELFGECTKESLRPINHAMRLIKGFC